MREPEWRDRLLTVMWNNRLSTGLGPPARDAGWPVTAEVLPGRYHTDFIESPGIPKMDDLIVQVANDPAG